MAEDLIEALGLHRCRYVFIVGGGGKTTLMFALARDLVSAGRRVVTTTSTRILPPSPEQSATLLVECDPKRLIAELTVGPGHTTVVSAQRPDGKVQGLSLEALDDLHRAAVVDTILVEADGSRGLSLKAHAEHEPVVSSAADLVIAVIGADCVSRTVSREFVHRPELLWRRMGLDSGTIVTPDLAARILLHPEGFLSGVPQSVEVRVLVSKAGTFPREALGLEEALRHVDGDDRIARVVVAD